MYHSVFVRLFTTVCFLFNLFNLSLEAKLWKVSHTERKVPLHFRLLPIQFHVETSPLRTMKKPQMLFGKLRRSYTTSNEIQQQGVSQLKSSPKNQGIQQVINDTQESLGARTPAGAIINNLGPKVITLQQAQTANFKMFANSIEPKHNKQERPGKNILNLIEQTGHLPVRNLSTNSLNLQLHATVTTAALLNTLQETNVSESQNQMLVKGLDDALPSANSGMEKPTLSGTPQSSTPTEKLMCGNITCPFTLPVYPERKTSNAAVDVTNNRPEKAVSATSDVRAFNASGFLSNSSISQHKNNTASNIIPNKRLPQQGTNTQQVTGSRANLTTTGKANLKSLMTTPDTKDYRHWKTFSESKSKLKAYQSPFVGYNWVRNQDPTIGHTFNKIEDRRDHQFKAWIQQRHFEPTPLMRHPETRLQIHNKDDSVLPDPPKIYGPCRDYDPRCPSLVLAGWCDYPTSFSEEINFRDYCMASCGFCNNYQKNKDMFNSRKRTEKIEENGFPEYNENFFKRHVS